MSSRLLWVVAVLPLFGCDPITAPQVSRTTIMISVTPPGGPASDASSSCCISDDGRRVAFLSSASNLVADQTTPILHVYVKNRANGSVLLVTRNSDAGDVPVSCTPVGPPHISANGRFVTYTADVRPDNGFPNPSLGLSNVFVRDLQSHLTRRAIDKNIWPNAPCFFPCVSNDGRFVVFATAATNLGMGTPSNLQVYLSDLSTTPPTLRLVSHSNGIVGSNGNGDSNQPWISADGTVLCYLSASTNLDPAVDSDTLSDLYVATFDFSTVSDSVVISLNPAGIKGNGDVVSCQLAPDGNFAVFTTAASNMGVGVTNVMLRNLQTNQTTCMTLTSDGLGPNAPCQFPRVNSGGTRVVFTSAATNLTGFAGGTAQPYITVPGGGFELVSISDTGVVAASAGGFPSISSAGPWVVWVSAAANLVPPDSNGTTDIFARGPFGQ